MRFKLEESLRGAPDSELLDDMRQCAMSLGKETITMAEYAKKGRVHPSTIQRRFGSWPHALKLGGMQPSRSKIGIAEDELFENIRSLWISLGRQPRYSEIKAPDSKFSARTYEKRFGSWSEALRDFVRWANADTPDGRDTARTELAIAHDDKGRPTRRSRREISTRQRFRTLVRDSFRCKACGASPLTTPGTELHVDHIVPWSKGGETVDDNLETKCEQCNLGKGNAFTV